MRGTRRIRFTWGLPALFAAAACSSARPGASPSASDGGAPAEQTAGAIASRAPRVAEKLAAPEKKPAEQAGSAVASLDPRVAEKFAAFERDQDPDRIEEAFLKVEDANRNVTPGDRAARKEGLLRWLRFLAALDREIDPKWGPLKTVVPSAPLPPGYDGRAEASGVVDPATILDPVARDAYVRALRASVEKHRWFFVQTELRRIDENAMVFVKVFLASNYTSSEADRQEMEGLLSAAQLNDPLKERLRAVMPGG